MNPHTMKHRNAVSHLSLGRGIHPILASTLWSDTRGNYSLQFLLSASLQMMTVMKIYFLPLEFCSPNTAVKTGFCLRLLVCWVQLQLRPTGNQ